MLRPVLDVVEAHVGDGRLGWPELERLVRATAAVLATAQVAPDEVPWGRHLVHLDPAGRYNLQWDVFSPGYVGGAHAHGTWGAFFVLRGALWAQDLSEHDHTPIRTSVLGPGAAAAFRPPGDWHRVAAAPGPQVMSLHLYGPGFDLDEGVGLDAEGRPRRYRRGPWGDPARLAPLVRFP